MWRRVWIWRRKLRKGKAYCLRWHEDGRVRTEAVGPNLEAAERLQVKRERDLNSGRPRAFGDVPYDEFKDEELGVMKGRMAEKSLADLERTLGAFREFCRGTRLTRITPTMVERFFSRRLQEVSAATANKELRTLKAAFSRAARRGYLERNPASDVKQVREPEKTVRVLTAEEIGPLLSACPSPRWKALVALAVTTGMRLGEMLSLHWDDLDVESGTVWVRNRPGSPTKSRRNRVLALAPGVCGLLKQLPRSGELVFHAGDGRPWRNNVQTGFRRIVKRAGIKYCTLHDLRRTFVSQLAMAGVNEAVVQKLAGHASIGTTLKYYTHIMPEALRVAQARLPFVEVLRDVSDTYHGPHLLGREETGQVASRVTTDT